MGANGKGNGKKQGTGSSEPPARAEGGPTNGKAKEARLPSAPAEAEEAPAEAGGGEGEAKAGALEVPPVAASAPAEAAGRHEAAPTRAAVESDEPGGAAWAEPIARIEARWTWIESRLITFVLVSQILALVAWVFLNGLSESVATNAGTVFRAVLLA